MKTIQGWALDVSPRALPTAVLHGLRAAGVKAEKGKMWTGGKYPISLDLAIDIDCPFEHVARDRMTFAKVRLLVDPYTADLTVMRDDDQRNGCPYCDQQSIDRWLWTCQGHDENGHPDHKPGHIWADDFPEGTPDEVVERILAPPDAYTEGRWDDSPWGHIFAALEAAEEEESDRWIVSDPEGHAKARRDSAHKYGLRPPAPESIESEIAKAKARLSKGTKSLGDTKVVIEPNWTDETAGQWLAEHDIPATVSHREAWALAQAIEGHPSKQWVEAGHRLRKSRL